jgi:tetratricopeptide (TPR) repeat protein
MNPPPQLEPSGDTGTWAYAVTTRWYQRKLVWVAVILLVLGGYVALPVAKRRFDRWNEDKRVDRARVSLEKGDFKRAALDARAVLDSNPQNTEANRLIAKAMEASGSPAALSWRVRLQSLLPDDAENLLALAKDALDAGDLARAKSAIERLKPAETLTATFHEVSARLAMSRRDTAAAETHLQEACRLAPNENRHRLALATLLVDSKRPESRAAALGVLGELAGQPDSSLPALRILLGDAQKHAQPGRIKELALALTEAPGATFSDKLKRLGILRKLDSLGSASYLGELRELAKSNADHLLDLLMWMNQNDLALIASEWLPEFPKELLSKPPGCIGAAETYIKCAEWAKLRKLVEGGSWGDFDYMRRAYLSRALDRLRDGDAGAAEWKNAVSAAQSAPDGPARLERLAKAAEAWHWDQRVEDVCWLLARTGHCPRWALDLLLVNAYRQGNTAQVQMAASLISKADPGGITARNFYTFISLLTRTQEGDPHRRAKDLYEELPTDPAVTATYALSLYQRGKMSEAVAAMATMKPEELRKPGGRFAFFHGVFLIAADRSAEAEEFLQLAGNRTLLPEEKAILLREKEAAKKRVEDARERQNK